MEETEMCSAEDPFIDNGDEPGKAEPAPERKRDKEYWMCVLQTFYIFLMFMSMGMIDGVRGPAILDLTELFQTTVQVLSGTAICSSTGAMVGALSFGWLLDRYPHRRAAFSFLLLCLMGLPVMTMTLVVNIYMLYVFHFIYGVGAGGIENAGNVGCLLIWRGREDGGPFMHAVHFGYSFGTVIGPLITAPFLKSPGINVPVDNSTEVLDSSDRSTDIEEVPGIVQLYVMVGCLVVAAGLGYLVMAIRNCFKAEEWSDDDANAGAKNDKPDQKTTVKLILFVGLMCIFYFLYVGVEVVTGTYIATFAVKSELNASKVDGAYVTALFWGSFSAFRFVAIFLAIYLNPLTTMLISFGLCLSSGFGLIIFAQDSLIVLQVLIAIMGIGMASIYATGLLWMENYIVVTNKIGAAYSFSAMSGPDLFPILAGTFIVQYPMSLMYLVLSTVIGCVIIFALSACVGQQIKKENESKATKNADL